MKKMKFLISQLYLLALFALPFVSTSCSDDDDNSTKVEISSLGVEDGTTIVTGQIIQLEAQLSNPQGEVHYSWSTVGKEVSTQSTYTFQSDVTGTHTITLTVTANNEAQEKSINIIVVKPPFYVINEGQGKGSVNRYKQEQWQYNIVEGLGVTSTVGIINNGYMYIVSKKSPFLVKMNLENNQIVNKIEDGLDQNAQGQNFCIVNNETGILTTSNGAFKVNLKQLTLGEKLSGLDAVSSDNEDIYKTDKYIFISSKNTIKVYNTNDLSFKQDIAYQIKTGFAQTKDGTLWGANGNKLIKINVETLDYEEVELPNGLSVFYNQWAYTPTGLCASITENALYLVQMFEEGYSVYGKNIYKYNVETKNATLFFSAPAADKSVYGAGVQVDPRNGDVYIIYTEDGWSTHYLNTNIYIANGVTGTQKEVIDYTGTYWFPSTIAFQ